LDLDTPRINPQVTPISFMAKHPTEIPPCRLAFAVLVHRPEATIDLAEATLLIAKEEYPALDIGAYLARLDVMGAALQATVQGVAEPRRQIEALNRLLFAEHGFRGNSEDYYDPRNSFLNEVLDRRTGIPITLSVVYLAVARRASLPLVGVGMPGHFLVKHVGPDGEIVIDPFAQGAVLSPPDCQQILDRIFDGKVAFSPQHLAPVGAQQILGRMLTNLKTIYFNNQEYSKALSAVDRLLVLNPQSATEIRDRGLLASQLRRYTDAGADLERYLRMAPQAEDREVIREYLRALRRRVGALN
jgi:regulator of sirC expression with transglutaminase-like and TPR domain